jgi:hypothetical protein
MKREFHYGKPRFEKRSGEKYMFVETAARRAQPKQRSGTTQLHTAYRSATSRGSTLCSDILPFSTAYIRTTYPMRNRTSYTYMGVIRPDNEVKLTTSRKRETSPFIHESSLRDVELQNLT